MSAGQSEQSSTEAAHWWSTSLIRIGAGSIDIRGYAIEELIRHASFPETIWLLLRGEFPSSAEASLLEAALVASVDHGPQAPSIAAARMAATCGVGLNNAVATGVNLLGDVHGGAGQQCMETLALLCNRAVAGERLDDAARDLVRTAKLERSRLPGFGHRFHPRDPRRDPLLTAVETAVHREVVSGRFLEAATALERALGREARPIPMNIDGVTAVVYSELGFPPELGRGLFVLSRSVGILAHAWEERSSGSRIKGPLPKSMLAPYDGPERRGLPDGVGPHGGGGGT